MNPQREIVVDVATKVQSILALTLSLKSMVTNTLLTSQENFLGMMHSLLENMVPSLHSKSQKELEAPLQLESRAYFTKILKK